MFLSGIALLLGFARELVIASRFGLSPDLDAYIAVLGFHVFFGTQIGNALENAFVSKVAALGGGHHVATNLRSSFRSLVAVNIAVAAFLLLFANSLLNAIFPAFTASQHALSVKILYFLIFSIAFANTAGLVRGGLYVARQFAPGFLSGSVISLSTILTVLLFSRKVGIASLVGGFIIGNFLVLVLFVIVLKKNGVLSQDLRTDAYRPKRFYIWSAAALVILTEIFSQAYSITQRSFASTLKVGTISSFYYATTLVMVPLSLFMTPVTTTLFPRLTETFSKDPREGVRMLRKYGGILFLFSVAIVALAVKFSHPLVRLIFVRGRFSLYDARRTADIFSVLVFFLPFSSISRLATYSFYALSDYRTPIYCRSFEWLMLLVLGAFLVPRYGATGLAYTSVIATICWSCLLLTLLMLKTRNVRSGANNG